MKKYLGPVFALSWPIVGAISVVAGVLYYFLFYNDGANKIQEMTAINSKITEAKTSLEATKKAAENADKFEREVKELSEQFSHLLAVMPEKLTMAELTSMVMDVTLKSGVKLLKTDPKTEPVHGEFFDSLQIGLIIEGTFSQVATFLSQLSRIPRLMTMDHVELVNETDVTTETPKLTFRATLVGYRYVPEVVDKKAAPGPGAPAKPHPPQKESSREIDRPVNSSKMALLEKRRMGSPQ